LPGSPESTLQDYRDAIMTENILLKPTISARKEGFTRLRQLYALDKNIILFRSLRMLWDQDQEAQPILALLCGIARDPLLRATVNSMISMPEETRVDAHYFSQIIQDNSPDQLTMVSLASVGRNIASSWSQSGHLSGRNVKVRKLINASPIVTAYALFLAYLCDIRGEALFDSPWVKILDTPRHILYQQAQQASQFGWLEYRHSGAITDITFHYLLKD